MEAFPQNARKIAKDIPWGWVVTFGAMFNTMFSVGSVPVLGVYFTDWQEEFESSRTSISGVSSLSFSIICAMTPVATILAKKVSCRTAIIAGGLLMMLGYFIVFFCTSLLQLYIFIGIVAYSGGSFAYSISYISVTEYMDNYLCLANAIANCGCPLASMILPMIFDYIRSELAWRNAILVSAGVYFHICLMGVLMRPNLPRKVADADEKGGVIEPLAIAVENDTADAGADATADADPAPVDNPPTIDITDDGDVNDVQTPRKNRKHQQQQEQPLRQKTQKQIVGKNSAAYPLPRKHCDRQKLQKQEKQYPKNREHKQQRQEQQLQLQQQQQQPPPHPKLFHFLPNSSIDFLGSGRFFFSDAASASSTSVTRSQSTTNVPFFNSVHPLQQNQQQQQQHHQQEQQQPRHKVSCGVGGVFVKSTDVQSDHRRCYSLSKLRTFTSSSSSSIHPAAAEFFRRQQIGGFRDFDLVAAEDDISQLKKANNRRWHRHIGGDVDIYGSVDAMDGDVDSVDGGDGGGQRRHFFELLQSPLFGWYLAFSTIFFSSIYTPGIFIVPYAVKSVGLSQMHASSLVSIFASAILFGSIGSGLVLSIGWMRYRKTKFLLVCMSLLGCVSIFISLARTYAMLALLVGLYGTLYGVWGATYFTIMFVLFGEKQLPWIASAVHLFASVTIFGGPPLAGIISTYFQWYGLVFVFAGSVILFSCLFLLKVVRIKDELGEAERRLSRYSLSIPD